MHSISMPKVTWKVPLIMLMVSCGSRGLSSRFFIINDVQVCTDGEWMWSWSNLENGIKSLSKKNSISYSSCGRERYRYRR
ncbi:hypothetical protein BDR22DRAFT_844135 [Usnea florida]